MPTNAYIFECGTATYLDCVQKGLRPQNIAIDCWQESANPISPTRNSFPPKSHSIQSWGN